MTYAYLMENLIHTDDHKNWAHECNSSAMSLVLTARLALQNDEGSICPDADRMCVVADTLEVAYALMRITAEGVDQMQREGPYGPWKTRRDASCADNPSGVAQ